MRLVPVFRALGAFQQREGLPMEQGETRPSVPERVATAIFNTCGNFKNLIGLSAIALLSIISITFNYKLGQLMGSDTTTRELFPVGFAALDLSALFLAAWLTIKSKSFVRKGIAWLWLTFLICLSVWAAMSFTLASDAKLRQESVEQIKAMKMTELAQANKQVAVAQRNYDKAVRYKTPMLAHLDKAKASRDALVAEIERLNEKTPPAGMAIYHHTETLLAMSGVYVGAETIAGFVRMIWALALTLSPFVLTGLLAFEVAQTRQTKMKIEEPVKPRMSDFQGENIAKSEVKPALKLVKPQKTPFKAIISSLSGSKQGTNQVCMQSVEKVQAWLETQSGRIKRDKIAAKCLDRRNYRSVSMVIEELEKRGALVRRNNGQLIVNRAKEA